MPPLHAAVPLPSSRRHDDLRPIPPTGEPAFRLGRTGCDRPRRTDPERVLFARAQGRCAAEEADHDDLDRTATGLPPDRRARAERAGPAATCPGRQDRQLPRRPTTPGRPRQSGHRLRRARRGRHHPLRRRLPVSGRFTRRPGPVGPQHRHRDPGSTGHPARGTRRRHQPRPGQHRRVADRERRPGQSARRS